MNIIQQIVNAFKHDTDNELMVKLEQESAARRNRNEERMAKIKQEMGERWVLHPSHKKSRLEEPRPV